MKIIVAVSIMLFMISGCSDRAIEITKNHSFDDGTTIKSEVARLAGVTGRVSWESTKAEGLPDNTRSVTVKISNEAGEAGIQWLVNMDTNFIDLHAIRINGEPRNLLTGPIELETWAMKAKTNQLRNAMPDNQEDTATMNAPCEKRNDDGVCITYAPRN
jgi:hypothetical protein